MLHKRSVAPVGRLLDTLKILLGAATPACECSSPALVVKVCCSKCGEIISTRIDKANDMECEYMDQSGEDELPAPVGYHLIKEVVGRNCQNIIQFKLHFNSQRRVVRQEIVKGTFVSQENVQ